MKHCLSALAVASLLLFGLAPRAEAACISPTQRTGTSMPNPVAPSMFQAGSSVASVRPNNAGASIVGLWKTTFYAGNGPDIWDQAFELWHSDGTEMAIDDAVPPSLGNVCVGVWKQVGRTIKLRHYTWNWNGDGTKAGVFELVMTVSVDRGGETFSGKYVSDSYDLNGNTIPELHAEGVVRGMRISVD